MAAFGVDNFLGELTIDGNNANFHFWDADDPTNVQDIVVSPKEFPEGVISADSREVSDYAYSLVAEKMNAVRSDRIKATEVKQVSDTQDREKAERAATSSRLAAEQDSQVASAGTEKREDGVTQTVYNTATPSDAPAKKK